MNEGNQVSQGLHLAGSRMQDGRFHDGRPTEREVASDLPKVLRFSMDINSAFCRKRPLKAECSKKARGESSETLE